MVDRGPRQAFRTTLEADPRAGHRLDRALRWARQPSYTGPLLTVAEFRSDDAELDRVLGEAYSFYESDKARRKSRIARLTTPGAEIEGGDRSG